MKDKKHVFEIRGVGFVNKGAELMLNAIQQELATRYGEVVLVIEVGYKELADQKRRKILIQNLVKSNLSVRISGSYKKIPLKFISKFLFPDLHSKINIVSEKDIDVILDASGFAFGDQWGVNFAKTRMTNKIQKWSRQGKAIILLPQAFGPFNNSLLIQEVKLLVKYSDLIFARDEISYEFIKDIEPKSGNITLMPDFTNLILPNLEKFKNKFSDKIAIIPNFKMITSKNKSDGDNYIKILQICIERIQKAGLTAFFLMHEGKKDEEIANIINSKLERPIDIVWEDSAIGIKSIIGSSYAVITSRFHGLVSALSQGVPCLATSWSHKYEMLLKDYNYSKGLLSLTSNEEEVESSLNNILTLENNNKLRIHLSEQSKDQKDKTRRMWGIIFDYLRKNYGFK